MKRDIEIKIKTNFLFENQERIDNAVKDIFDYPECRVIMEEFIVEGYKRVVYEIKNTQEQINSIKEKLENKLKTKIKDVEVEIKPIQPQ
jgi:hypothetical protein